MKRNLLIFKPSAWDLFSVSNNQSYSRVNRHTFSFETVYVLMFHVEKLFAVKTLGFFVCDVTTCKLLTS